MDKGRPNYILIYVIMVLFLIKLLWRYKLASTTTAALAPSPYTAVALLGKFIERVLRPTPLHSVARLIRHMTFPVCMLLEQGKLLNCLITERPSQTATPRLFLGHPKD